MNSEQEMNSEQINRSDEMKPNVKMVKYWTPRGFVDGPEPAPYVGARGTNADGNTQGLPAVAYSFAKWIMYKSNAFIPVSARRVPVYWKNSA